MPTRERCFEVIVDGETATIRADRVPDDKTMAALADVIRAARAHLVSHKDTDAISRRLLSNIRNGVTK